MRCLQSERDRLTEASPITSTVFILDALFIANLTSDTETSQQLPVAASSVVKRVSNQYNQRRSQEFDLCGYKC